MQREKDRQKEEEDDLKRTVKHIPKAPAPAKTVMIKEQLDGKKEVERVDINHYREVPDWTNTGDWSKARLKQTEKARE